MPFLAFGHAMVPFFWLARPAPATEAQPALLEETVRRVIAITRGSAFIARLRGFWSVRKLL